MGFKEWREQSKKDRDQRRSIDVLAAKSALEFYSQQAIHGETRVSDSARLDCSVSWDQIKAVMYWTLQNAKHLDADDHYLIEKEIDACHVTLNSQKKQNRGISCDFSTLSRIER